MIQKAIIRVDFLFILLDVHPIEIKYLMKIVKANKFLRFKLKRNYYIEQYNAGFLFMVQHKKY